MRTSLDLGFEDAVLRINRSKPGQITHFMEPQTAETAYAWWATEVLIRELDRYRFDDRDKQVSIMMNYLKQFAIYDVGRDKAVFSLVDQLRKENPYRAIIIPRGTAHRGMRVLFTPDNYDVLFKESEDARLLDFGDEFIGRSYVEIPSNEEVHRYAELQLDYMNHRITHRYTLPQIFRRLFTGKLVAELTLVAASRQYALSKNSPSF